MLATDAGASRLGELGLGCNPRITRFTRNVLFDEKIDGTVHLALGASYTYAGGTTRAPCTGTWSRTCAAAASCTSTARSSSATAAG